MVGMHVAADPTNSVNVGVDLYNLIVPYEDETISNVENDIYPREPRFTNRKQGKKEEPKFKGKPWADYDSDESVDGEYFDEADFRPSPPQARAEAEKPCKPTTTAGSETNSSQPSSLKEFWRQRAENAQRNLQNSGPSNSESDPSVRTPQSLSPTLKSSSDSQRSETSPILRSDTSVPESSDHSVMPADKRPPPAQADAGAKKRTRRRRKPRKKRNSSQGANTSSRTTTNVLGGNLSNEQLGMLFRKFLESQPQGVLSTPSEQPTSRC